MYVVIMAGGRVHPNSHPQDSALVISDKDGKVTNWLHKEEPRIIYRNAVNAGIHIMSGEICDIFPWPQGKADLDRDIFRQMIPMGGLYSYHFPEYIKDMGTPERVVKISKTGETGTGTTGLWWKNWRCCSRNRVFQRGRE